jgi:hypothetical protein
LFGCHGRYSRPGVRYLFFVGANPNDTSTKNYVSPGPGTLALNDVTLEGGLAQGGGSDLGGGGAGMGGAIFNQGTVVIDDSTLTDNVAQGGNAGDTSVGSGGGGIGTDASASGGGGGVGGGGGQGDPNSFGEGGGGGFGGGGAGGTSTSTEAGGRGGFGGGGGAGMGGAIFNMQGDVTITNSTLTGNAAVRSVQHLNCDPRRERGRHGERDRYRLPQYVLGDLR